ncbi:FecR family protein [Leeuwenhoekiella sp. A16]|uniref:FecR family protein n=1 Tax=unclassified Leeuwenhoekiella TaxID=2615029 RepID=UPI003A8010E3
MKNYEYHIVEKLKKSWDAPYPAISGEQVELSWKSVEKQIKKRPIKLLYNYSLAAAIAMLLFATYYFAEVYNPIIVVNNYAMMDKEVNLPDGSLVLLKKGSEIRYKENFDEARGVELEGEAFFNVVQDSLKEFRVKTSHTLTRAIGTSFLVNEKLNMQETEVSLYSGKILVHINGITNKKWSIKPGESFVYNQAGEAYITKFNTLLSFESGNLFIDLNAKKLENLFDFLSERFDYEFTKNDFTKDKLVTLRINKSDSLTDILKILSIINHTNYEINHKTRQVNVFKN